MTRRFARRHRPSPAMAVALTALFLSLGGVSYGVATGSIDSREIKNNTIRSRDVRNGALIGRDARRDSIGGRAIKESALGTVPNANATDGHHFARVDFRAPSNTETRQVLSISGLALNASCGNRSQLVVRARTTVNDAMIHVGTIRNGNAAAYSQNNDFDAANAVSVLPGATTAVQGTLTYVQPVGTIVTVHFLAQEAGNALNSSNDCFFVGSVTAG